MLSWRPIKLLDKRLGLLLKASVAAWTASALALGSTTFTMDGGRKKGPLEGRKEDLLGVSAKVTEALRVPEAIGDGSSDSGVVPKLWIEADSSSDMVAAAAAAEKPGRTCQNPLGEVDRLASSEEREPDLVCRPSGKDTGNSA